MSTFLYTLGRWSFRHPWRVLTGWLLILVIAGGGVAVFAKGTDNTFSIPGTESQAGLEMLGRTFPQVSGASAQIIVVSADGTSVRDQNYQDAVQKASTDIGRLDFVEAVTDPYDARISGGISDDGRAAIVRIQFAGESTEVPAATKDALRDATTALGQELPSGSQAILGGQLFATEIPGASLTEALGVLIAALVLMVTFRSFLVAGMPLATAILGVALSIGLIFIATGFATVSSTTPLLAVMLGLAVGIDYALFIVSRHQDQTRAGMDPEESTARAVGTAGSAVVFAGITVLIALIGLSFAGIPFLTTMGIAASVAVAIAVCVGLTLTPAFLGFAGHRVVGWGYSRSKAARRRRDMSPPQEVDADAERERETTAEASRAGRTGPAQRWVGLVTRHPVVTTVAVIGLLGVTAIPAASLALTLPNAGQLPQGDEARVAYELTDEYFGPGANGPLIMTGTIVTSNDPLNLMTSIGDEIAKIPGVAKVALATPNATADTGIVQIVPETAPDDPRTADLVRELRAAEPRLYDQFGVHLLVTGYTAVTIDISDQLGAALLPFGLFVVGLSLVLLMIVFRSVWVPLTAAGGYLLSVAASFGVVAAVFEWGWFADALHVAKVGPIISFMPIVVMGVLFGLAMDYQVFLVSRMREDYVHADREGRTPREVALGAVRSGFSASARVVVAAAVIMFAVFVAFVPEGDSSLKPIALGLAVGVAVDAFLVRMTLVPAILALLGAKAWWMPRWLDRLLPKLDVEGEAVEREVRLADWPSEPSIAIAADDLRTVGSTDAEEPVFSDVSLRLPYGETLLVTGETRTTRALLLALSGRMSQIDGRLRVDGLLVPERAGAVRSRVGVALLDDPTEAAADIARAASRGTRVVLVSDIDRLDDDAREDVAQVLRRAATDARERSDDASSPFTLVVSARDERPALALLAQAQRPDVTTLALPTPRRHRPEPETFADLSEVFA
ncbi:RND superfamily putative drug exporter [Microbacterium testaceum]|uniref:MMPL family transporter n=1 Tax=Microbacterium TaxID=33882 RepID=UPI0027803749|nr:MULTISPECIES: MMPL family transporter [Microbacterium]MDQ1112456.1 RND superfamily putative drug exporter [Microbacterium testaceum]MDR6097007.1 RND superfamily putative drug exporter [Microbacterium sp. SORGH_AS_0454]